MSNLFKNLPKDLTEEFFEVILKKPGLKVERIISNGHISPKTGWYDQKQHEWVVVLQGSGTLSFEDGSTKTLNVGDYINIPAHQKHKVSHTSTKEKTVWLSIFYD